MIVAYHKLKSAKELSRNKEFTSNDVLEEMQWRFANKALSKAKQMYDDNLFSSSMLEAKKGLKFWPDMEELSKLKGLAEREINADSLGETASLLICKGDPKGAMEKLQKAAQVSTVRSGLFKAAFEEVRELEKSLAFERARILEAKGSLEDALKGFKALMEKSPGFKDVESRVLDLEASMNEAKKILQKVMALVKEGKKLEARHGLKELFSLFPWDRKGLQIRKMLRKKQG